jgi:hypothetical protein
MKIIINKLIDLYNLSEKRWHSLRTSRIISNIVLLFFTGGLLVTFLSENEIIAGFHVRRFFAIELAFSVLLITEILGLVFVFTHSVADSIGKQFEIVSLIFLRDSFKELGHLPINAEWNKEMLMELLPVLADALGAVLIFLIIGLFYKAQKHAQITANQEEQDNFVKVKKLVAIVLLLIFVVLGIYDATRFLHDNQFSSSFNLYYTVLIFTDVFVLIFSSRYASRYIHLFRYSSFTLATVFIRLSLSAPQYFNVLLSISAGLFILMVTYTYNFLNRTTLAK